ncbi:MAG: hypothetical protein ACLPV8_27275 [Steroidobacteraceae bacterium]
MKRSSYLSRLVDDAGARRTLLPPRVLFRPTSLDDETSLTEIEHGPARAARESPTADENAAVNPAQNTQSRPGAGAEAELVIAGRAILEPRAGAQALPPAAAVPAPDRLARRTPEVSPPPDSSREDAAATRISSSSGLEAGRNAIRPTQPGREPQLTPGQAVAREAAAIVNRAPRLSRALSNAASVAPAGAAAPVAAAAPAAPAPRQGFEPVRAGRGRDDSHPPNAPELAPSVDLRPPAPAAHGAASSSRLEIREQAAENREPTVRIGNLEVRISAPAAPGAANVANVANVANAAVAPPATAARPKASLARGFTGFGLLQG